MKTCLLVGKGTYWTHVRLQLPNTPHYLAEAYITVTNNILPWMKDLHSADLPIATTEPITSHNECLQVVKSSAIAKHLTEWSDILWKDSHTPGNTTKLRLYQLFKTTYVIDPYLVIMVNSQLRKDIHVLLTIYCELRVKHCLWCWVCLSSSSI